MRANRVIGLSFVVAGVLAAAVSVLYTVSNPLVQPQMGVPITIFALVGVVVGGLDRLWSAALGGFAVGFVYGMFGDLLSSQQSVYLPSVVYGAVILVLLLRPAASSRRSARARWSAYEARAARARRAGAARRRDGVRGRRVTRAQLEFENALVMIAIVVALYVFVGNSGVISFGHVSFVAVGAYLAGVLTVDPDDEEFTMPGLFPSSATRTSAPCPRSRSRRSPAGSTRSRSGCR